MNMKSILTYLAVLTLSFNVFAVEVQEEPVTTTPKPITLHQENSPDTPLTVPVVNSRTTPQAMAAQPSEFITALSVYSIIIVVYSIYGFKTKPKNIGN